MSRQKKKDCQYQQIILFLGSDGVNTSSRSVSQSVSSGRRGYLDGKLQLIKELTEELIMRNRFAGLHNANNGRIHLELSILENTFIRRSIFLCCLLELNRIDLDSRQRSREFIVEGKFIRLGHFLGFWSLDQNTMLSTG